MIKSGSRVAWNHAFGMHAPESVILAESVPAGSPVGTVVGDANDSGSWLEVQIDGEKATRVLTIDELVRISEPMGTFEEAKK